ncbi:UNVERIFIED_ORG: putative membrane protein [Rhizobium esperanzae]
MTYFALKFLHIIGATVLLGTGAGIAFFMLIAHRTGNAKTVAAVARIVVFADFAFTTTAVIAQPVTGLALAWYVGYSLWEHWIVSSIVLYLITGAFWLPFGYRWRCARLRKKQLQMVSRCRPIPSAVLDLVLFWLSGLCFSAGNSLADDHAPGWIVRVRIC